MFLPTHSFIAQNSGKQSVVELSLYYFLHLYVTS